MKLARALLVLPAFAWLALAALVVPLGLPAPAAAQSTCAYIAFGSVMTPGQWNACFASKQDYATGLIRGPNSVTAGNVVCWSTYVLLTDCGSAKTTVQTGTSTVSGLATCNSAAKALRSF